MFLLNSLKTPDIVFFSLIAVVVVLCIAIYFLIPIVKKKEYEERRENLKKREAVFRANLKNLQAENVKVEETKESKTNKKAQAATKENENSSNQ